MKLAAWASAVVSIASVGGQLGWWHSLAATLVVLGLWVTVNVIRHRPWMRARNGHDLAREKAHHAADSIIMTMGAAIGTEAARDLALEASAILDDMAAAGATAAELMEEGRRLARTLPAQVRVRARTRVVTPTVQPAVAEYRRMVVESVSTTWEIVTTAKTKEELLSVVTPVRHLSDDFFLRERLAGFIVVVRFRAPVARFEIASRLLDHRQVLRLTPVPGSDGSLFPRSAG